MGCFKKYPQFGLVRVVRSAKGELRIQLPFSTVKLSGRGVYLCARLECFEKTLRKKNRHPFTHSLKVPVDESFLQQLREAILHGQGSESSDRI